MLSELTEKMALEMRLAFPSISDLGIFVSKCLPSPFPFEKWTGLRNSVTKEEEISKQFKSKISVFLRRARR